MTRSTKIWMWTLLLMPLQPQLTRRGLAMGLSTQVNRADVTREADMKMFRGFCYLSEARHLFGALPSRLADRS